MNPSSTPTSTSPTSPIPQDLAVLTRSLATQVLALTLGTAAVAIVLRAIMVFQG